MCRRFFHFPLGAISNGWHTLELTRLFVLMISVSSGGSALQLHAQIISGIQGLVVDQQGLPISGVEIIVQAKETGVISRSETDSGGGYTVFGLPPGTYTVSASRKNFVTSVSADLDLSVNRLLHLDFTLVVGNNQERVTVVAIPPLLDTSSSSTGSTILPAQVRSMPINGRNYLDLLQLVPGVNLNRTVHEGDDNSAPILGERANNAYILIDGMPNRDEVDGALLKDASAFDVIAAVRAAILGKASCAPQLCTLLFHEVAKIPESCPSKQPRKGARLTLRQGNLMRLVATGMTNKEIAMELGLSEFTVKNHMSRILRQLDVEDRSEAVEKVRSPGYQVSA